MLALPLGLLLIPGCRRSEITTYLAPKEVPYSPPGGEMDDGHNHGAPPAAAPAPAPETPPVSYTVPADWKEMPKDVTKAPMFICATPQGEVGIKVIAMDSMEGRENILVSMWRGSFGLPELSEEETQKALVPVEIAGERGQLFEIGVSRANQPASIVTAFTHRGGKSWFFKMEGPTAAVESQKTAFTAFLKTVKF